MRTLRIRPVGNVYNNYIVNSNNIYEVFSSIVYEPKLFIVEEVVKEFLINMLNPDAYSSESEFYWEGNCFCPPINAWFE